MDIFIPKKAHLREALLFCFHLNKSAAESHRMLAEAYGKQALSETCCRDWFRKFKSGEYDLQDKPRPGQPKLFEDEYFEKMLTTDPCQTSKTLAKMTNMHKTTICRRLHAMGYKPRCGDYVPHKLKDSDVAKRISVCQMLLDMQRKKSFLHRIITCDEKWIFYENSNKKKSWVKSDESVVFTPKRNLHGRKVLLSIFWDQKGIIYYEILKNNERVDAKRYQLQLIKMRQALHEQRPEYAHRHETVLLQHDNARPHVSILVKNTIADFGWEVLPHPPYSPDIAPCDYHLFRSMQHGLSEQRFLNDEDVKQWLDWWKNLKKEEFFYRGIHMLPEKWETVLKNNGQYFA